MKIDYLYSIRPLTQYSISIGLGLTMCRILAPGSEGLN
jgi:hypothetical protein